MDHEVKRRFGFKRWIIVALIIFELVLTSLYPPFRPPTELAAEPLTDPVTLPVLGTMSFTNTILTVLIADVILILIALAVSRAYQKSSEAPGGIAGMFETMVEGVYNLVESVAGSRWARTFFPLVATILFLVMTVNFMKLFPGMESIGFLHEIHGEGEGFVVDEFGPFYILSAPEEGAAGEEIHTDEEETLVSEAEAGAETGVTVPHEGSLYNIIPFFRPASTDLNFTMAIAITAMVTVQVIGLRAGGPGYLTKFFNFGPFLKMWITDRLGAFDILMPFINIFVGILELIAEFARIISFTFRLFGSMFAGAILLGVTGALFQVLQLPFLFLEIFFGAVQAFVFAMLTLVFLTMATQTHGGGHEEGHEAH